MISYQGYALEYILALAILLQEMAANLKPFRMAYQSLWIPCTVLYKDPNPTASRSLNYQINLT